jgi:probable F420-dependent oxidoreductase
MVDIGRGGIWQNTSWHAEQPDDVLAELRELGYTALWLGGSPRADLRVVEELLDRTAGLVVATGVARIWDEPPEVAAAAYHRVQTRHPDRALVGLGISHRFAVGGEYVRPHDALVSYLDGLDAAAEPLPARARVLAALGERTLRLAAERAAGAHPYLVTPEHTERARTLLGGGLLAPEQKVVLDTDPASARAIARDRVTMYLSMPNYVRTLRGLGFTDDDVATPGSDRLIDALVAWGDEEAIRRRIDEHRAAGADHVAVQVLNDDKVGVLRRLGPVLN